MISDGEAMAVATRGTTTAERIIDLYQRYPDLPRKKLPKILKRYQDESLVAADTKAGGTDDG